MVQVGQQLMKKRAPSTVRLRIAAVVMSAALVASCVPSTSYVGVSGRLHVWMDDIAGTLTATWSPPPDATSTSSYELSYWRTAQSQLKESVITAETTVVLDDIGGPLTDGTWYSFAVRAVDGDVKGRWTAETHSLYVEPDLPAIRINTTEAAPILDKVNYVTGTYALDGQGADPPASGSVEVRGRGNTTWDMPKRPYRLKLGAAASLLGMPSNRHWVLLANHFDPSELRNSAAFALSEGTDLAWTPRSRYVELILNGSYEGIYQLTEHIRRDTTRVNVQNVASQTTQPGITGGYIFEMDFWAHQQGDPGFHINSGIGFKLDDPEPPPADAPPLLLANYAQQRAYIQNYVQTFDNVLYSPTFADPVTGYAAYIDVDSFIDWYLVNEIAHNDDAMGTSTWFYKPRSEKVKMGPVWDFDRSMGVDGTGAYDEYWVRTRIWIHRLFEDPAFVDRVKVRWSRFEAAFRQVPASIVAAGQEPDFAMAAFTDGLRWGQPYDLANLTSLADWMTNRLNWLDEVTQYGDGIAP